MAENELERFVRFSKAVARDIPTTDGEKLVPLLMEQNEDDIHGTILDITHWLVKIGFSEEDAISVIKMATFYSAQNVFDIDSKKKVSEA